MSVCVREGPAVTECRFNLNEESEISGKVMRVCNMCGITGGTLHSPPSLIGFLTFVGRHVPGVNCSHHKEPRDDDVDLSYMR